MLKFGIHDLWGTLQNRTFGFFDFPIFRNFMGVQSPNFCHILAILEIFAIFSDFFCLMEIVRSGVIYDL